MNEIDKDIERPNPLESMSKTMHGFIWFEKNQTYLRPNGEGGHL